VARLAAGGKSYGKRVKAVGIEEVLIAPRSPWPNPFCERLVGSMCRECLDHMIVLNEDHLRQMLRSYFQYYHDSRTHQSLERNSRVPREVEPASRGKVLSIPPVGGLPHRYTRAA
jgi:transposase InsO family protein